MNKDTPYKPSPFLENILEDLARITNEVDVVDLQEQKALSASPKKDKRGDATKTPRCK